MCEYTHVFTALGTLMSLAWICLVLGRLWCGGKAGGDAVPTPDEGGCDAVPTSDAAGCEAVPTSDEANVMQFPPLMREAVMQCPPLMREAVKQCPPLMRQMWCSTHPWWGTLWCSAYLWWGWLWCGSVILWPPPPMDMLLNAYHLRVDLNIRIVQVWVCAACLYAFIYYSIDMWDALRHSWSTHLVVCVLI